LIKSTAVVGGLTLVSRLLGFIRDMILAALFGAGAGTDAFFVAFKLPNFVRRLFAEGAFAQAFVPVLADYKMQDDRQRLKTFLDRTAGALASTLLVITVIGVLAAPFLTVLFAPGFYWNAKQYELTVQMLRVTFPYVFFISLTAFCGGILNAFGRFAVPAFTPVLLNLSLIAAAAWAAPRAREPVLALAWAVFAAGILQLAFQIPFLGKLGLLPRLRTGFYDAGVQRILRSMLPAMLSVSVTQVNLLIDTLLASFLTVGSISWLYYSDRLVEFPIGIFGVALATVILPGLSHSHAAGRHDRFSRSLDWGLRWVVLLGLPAAIGLILLAEPIVSTLFQHDEFTTEDVFMTARSLMAYAAGLPAFILGRILVPSFTSRHDLTTPVQIGAIAILVNVLLSIALALPLAHVGLALATSIAASVHTGLLLLRLFRQRAYHPETGWPIFLCRVVAATAIMGGVLYIGVDTGAWSNWSISDRAWKLVAWIAVGITTYGICLAATGMRPSHLLKL
jgi:putative peptidoglycan lipid II flippase